MSGFDQKQGDIIGMLRSIINEETRWLKHYQGKVLKNKDPDNKCRVLVSIPEKGWEDESMAFWAFPRDKHGLSVPDIGEFVEIYFMNGSPSRPVYMGISWEGFPTSPVKNFDGDPQHHVLFEDPKDSHGYIKYSQEKKLFDISNLLAIDVSKKALTMLEGTEPFVLGNVLKTLITKMLTFESSHTHICAAPGSASGTGLPAAPTITDFLSKDIKGK